MSLRTATLRKQLSHVPTSGSRLRATALLDSEDVKSGVLNPVVSAASEILALWKTRERVSLRTGFFIPGVADLNLRLSRLSPSAQVQQYNFDSEIGSGSIFLDATTGELLGDTIVELRPEGRLISDSESTFVPASRKTA